MIGRPGPLGLCSLAAFWLLCGGSCATVQESTAALPSQNRLVRDQLVIHSDVELPARHRLFEDLSLERQELGEKLALPLSDEPVHVFLFDTPDKYAAFLRREFPQLPNRRAFFVETDTQLAVYAQWGDRVSEDLRHEVAHGYLHSVVPKIPLWLDEGLAEYFEVSRGHFGVNRPHVADLAGRLAVGGFRPDVTRLESLTEAEQMTQADYAESWAWTHWMLETNTQRRELLREHLRELRAKGTAPPLSTLIAKLDPGAAQSLVDHLYELAAIR